MPKAHKKTGKGRLDKYYHLAKEQGYRARSAFKLVQINKKYNILAKAKVLIDLCAAPGGWLQVAAKCMPPKSLIVGVDLDPIKPIPNVITHRQDITTDKCRAVLRQDLKTWKADVVLHDGAPNVGSAWLHDAYSQSELVLSSLKLAVEFLNKGGCFVTKVFRSKDYNNLMWVFNQLFGKVEATKPPSSRNVSAEIFVICRDFFAPKRIDPKFLDSKYVFQDIDPTSNMKPVDIFRPDVQTRHRGGYDEGDYTLHKARPVLEFVRSAEPTVYLGTVNTLTFDDTMESRQLASLPETTGEIRECLNDLKVLGKKDFKNLLKWRIAARESLTPKKAEDGVEADAEKGKAAEMEKEKEVNLDKELERLSKEEQARQKRAKRKANERRAKELLRMQLNMAIPTEIGIEQSAGNMADEIANDGLFDINRTRKRCAVDVLDDADMDEELEILDQAKAKANADYKERLNNKDAKYRARQSRSEVEEWHGISGDTHDSQSERQGHSSSEESSDEMDSFDETSDSESDVGDMSAVESNPRKGTAVGKLSRDTAIFFDNPLFKEFDSSEDEELDEPPALDKDLAEPTDTARLAIVEAPVQAGTKRKIGEVDGAGMDGEGECDDEIEVVPNEVEVDVLMESDDDSKKKKKPDYTLMASEAMTMAQQLVSRQKTKADLVDDGFNRYAFNDPEGLPDWFFDDERKHNRRQTPITKEAADAIKARLRALDARPIKKIAEAKARKKHRQVQQFNKMARKADALMENSEMSERSKARSVVQILTKGKKKPKKEVKLVVAKGANKGNKGRPKGVKGRYKMVDSRMKKEVRAEKRKQKGKKQRR